MPLEEAWRDNRFTVLSSVCGHECSYPKKREHEYDKLKRKPCPKCQEHSDYFQYDDRKD